MLPQKPKEPELNCRMIAMKMMHMNRKNRRAFKSNLRKAGWLESALDFCDKVSTPTTDFSKVVFPDEMPKG